jgi:acylpyruvate hydrolase
MRFAMIEIAGRAGIAAAAGEGQPFHARFADEAGYPGDLAGLVARGPKALREAGAALAGAPAVDLAAATFLIPLPNPPKIICIGLNYADHSRESGFEPPAYPTVFGRFASSLLAHNAPIIRPAVSEQLDYEGELVAVIGTGGRNIAKDQALSHVIGYSLFNEASIRDFQFKAPQWTVGKNFDATGAFGPILVTADELPPGGKGLRIQTRLNGEIVQDASTDDMIFDVATLIATLSEAFTLQAGDVIVTGTPAGVGLARKPQLWMKPGDVCEVEVEHIGTLRNPIAAG